MRTMTPRGALWRLVIAAAVGLLLLVALTNAISNPVNDQTRSVTADFTDVSGLHQGSDVRVKGVQVGKVESVDLIREDGQSRGRVRFTLVDRYKLTDRTHLAIKYQALTGLRYVDVTSPHDSTTGTTEGGPSPIVHVPVQNTSPSFDITKLFNGLQPVLATLSPAEVNTFTDNAVALLQGDGTGLGPMLDSINRLTRFATDRQQVVSRLMNNMSMVAESLGGRSPQAIQILDWFNRPLDAALEVLDEFRKSQLFGPGFSGSLIRLFDNLGIQRGLDIDQLLSQVFATAGQAAEAFRRMPGVIAGFAGPTGPEVSKCSHGRAELPADVSILLNGQGVTLCNAS